MINTVNFQADWSGRPRAVAVCRTISYIQSKNGIYSIQYFLNHHITKALIWWHKSPLRRRKLYRWRRWYLSPLLTKNLYQPIKCKNCNLTTSGEQDFFRETRWLWRHARCNKYRFYLIIMRFQSINFRAMQQLLYCTLISCRWMSLYVLYLLGDTLQDMFFVPFSVCVCVIITI